MSARKVAPAVEAVMWWPVPERFLAPGGSGAVAAVEVHVQARRELRALLAVARAAERASRNTDRPGGFCRYGEDEARFARALARLRAASGSRKRTGGR